MTQGVWMLVYTGPTLWLYGDFVSLDHCSRTRVRTNSTTPGMIALYNRLSPYATNPLTTKPIAGNAVGKS